MWGGEANDLDGQVERLNDFDARGVIDDDVFCAAVLEEVLEFAFAVSGVDGDVYGVCAVVAQERDDHLKGGIEPAGDAIAGLASHCFECACVVRRLGVKLTKGQVLVFEAKGDAIGVMLEVVEQVIQAHGDLSLGLRRGFRCGFGRGLRCRFGCWLRRGFGLRRFWSGFGFFGRGFGLFGFNVRIGFGFVLFWWRNGGFGAFGGFVAVVDKLLGGCGGLIKVDGIAEPDLESVLNGIRLWGA